MTATIPGQMGVQEQQGAALIAALTNSFHADLHLRQQAEKTLQAFEKNFAHRIVPILLEAISESRLELTVRQAASLRVKSLLAKR
jgi:hypothetical protein